jgi:predicted TIM-barrel fold metal-dependent hydrolase
MCLAIMFHAGARIGAQIGPDQPLFSEIAKIKAIDNHAHPLQVTSPGQADDEETYVSTIEPLDIPVRLRPNNPEYILAWRSLYGYKHHDMTEGHLRELREMKQRVTREQGDAYPSWALDQLGIEVMFANRVAMGRGLSAPRFRWVPFADPLMYPLNNRTASRANPDYRERYAGAERLLKRYLEDSGVSKLPLTLEGYLKTVVIATLERQKREGAIALKFATAYHRALDFANVPKNVAARVYARYVGGGEPTASEYKALQDYLFRHIAREAGRIGMPVHIHVGGGASGYFNQSGANPFVLEPVLNDPDLRRTQFILLHGGFPFAKEARALIYKPNVYGEFSGLTFSLSARELSEVLRSWLEYVPEKVLFGTDAFEISGEVSWTDHAWLTATSARQALALALTGMINDGEITRERALELARMVMRDNAAKLYKLEMQ